MALVMFLDESGDHSLSKIDPAYPVFVLSGVIMDEEFHSTTASTALAQMKRDLFGSTEIILHTAAFTRNAPGFEAMVNHVFRVKFFRRLEGWVEAIPFKLVACVIRKEDHLKKYGFSALDPYILSLSVLVERFVFETGSAGGAIVAEARDETLNNALELAFLDLKIRGTQFVSPKKIRERVHNFTIRAKNENIAGLQLADVVATPIGRHLLGKRTYGAYSQRGGFFLTLESKFRRDRSGKYEGMGLVVLPK